LQHGAAMNECGSVPHALQRRVSSVSLYMARWLSIQVKASIRSSGRVAAVKSSTISMQRRVFLKDFLKVQLCTLVKTTLSGCLAVIKRTSCLSGKTKMRRIETVILAVLVGCRYHARRSCR
jgi:hypothetical protein